MKSEPNKQDCNTAEEVKENIQSRTEDDEQSQLLAELGVTDRGLCFSNEHKQKISTKNTYAEKLQFVAQLVGLQRFKDSTTVLFSHSYKPFPELNPLYPRNDSTLKSCKGKQIHTIKGVIMYRDESHSQISMKKSFQDKFIKSIP